MNPSRLALARTMTEDDLKEAVVAAAGLHGWLVHHCRPARVHRGDADAWATPVEGNVGFVDLVLAHPSRGVLFRELKSERGTLDDAQRLWLATLSNGGANVGIWRPRDWVGGAIDLELRP